LQLHTPQSPGMTIDDRQMNNRGIQSFFIFDILP
jgi:hypothetical protein